MLHLPARPNTKVIKQVITSVPNISKSAESKNFTRTDGPLQHYHHAKRGPK